MSFIRWLNEIDIHDLNTVGGKNSSLGEMYCNLSEQNIKIPNAFVLTAHSYDTFISYNNLENDIEELLKSIDSSDLLSLREKAKLIRGKIANGNLPEKLHEEILTNYSKLSQEYLEKETDVAVRSSSTAEDLPDASFAGLQETFLNVKGEDHLIKSIKDCFASLYTDRAISYRKTMKYENNVTISVCIQKMVRSDIGCAGVAFSIDSESGFKDLVLINGSWGLGEMVVGGSVKPDEMLVYKKKLNGENYPIIDKKMGNKIDKMIYSDDPNKKTEIVKVEDELVHKFCLKNDEILKLTEWVIKIEEHYSKIHNKWSPMDIEWAYDGQLNEMFIVQARPETIISNKNSAQIVEYELNKNILKNILVTGISVGDKIGSGKVKILNSHEGVSDEDLSNFKKGDVLVTDITDPDWEPIMKIASAIITNKGGRVCHAAIVARELGIPAIVGSIDCTEKLKDGDNITISCAEGEVGYVYDGIIPFTVKKTDISELPKIKTNIMFNIGSPENAFKLSMLPNKGVGLAREEFIINNFIGVHPLALINLENLKDKEVQKKIREKIHGFKDGVDYFIKKLTYGISRIAAAFYPEPVILRLSDFKSNEYYNLLGGKDYEPKESNPMIGWRGCSRYYSDQYKEAFGLECKAIKIVRDEMGFTNVTTMLPFCRTPLECTKVLDVMKEYGLERGKNELKIALMCELPVNCILADEFCKHVDIFSIGSNDLTQTTLAVDRDSELIAHIFDERNEAVKRMIKMAIEACKRNGVKIGICGQGPSDYPDFAQFLVECGIDSISVTPDAILKTYLAIYDVEKTM